MKYQLNTAEVGLSTSAVLCIISTFLGWLEAGGQSINSYNSYFSGTPQILLVASIVVLVLTGVDVLAHRKVSRVFAGIAGILAGIVIAGTALITLASNHSGIGYLGAGGVISIGIGNYLALLSAVGLFVFGIWSLKSSKASKTASDL